MKKFTDPDKRMTGAGGAPEFAGHSKRGVYTMSGGEFVEKQDYFTTPGYVDGGTSRYEAGMPEGSGPSALITTKGIFNFDKKTKVCKHDRGSRTMREDTFAAAINCMDGRTQLPVITYLKETYGVDYVDTITEPGPDAILGDKTDPTLVESIRKRLEISVREHGSKNAAIVAHHDCAGNPVEPRLHLEQVERALDLIRSWGYGCEAVALWVDEEWKVHLVDEALKAEVRAKS